jgi:ribose/xylose/arabinose/galactoside ABC-type transport system permease subunit
MTTQSFDRAETAPAATAGREGAIQTVARRILRNLIWLLVLLVALFFAFTSHNFVSGTTVSNVLADNAALGILIVGETIVLFTGNFDLSIESTAGFTAMLAAWLMGTSAPASGWHLSPVLTIAVMLSVGALIGFLNGFFIVKLRMNNFMVTLSMLILLRGVTLVMTSGQSLYNLPDQFAYLGSATIGQVPVPAVVVLLTFGIAFVVMQYRPYGRHLYTVGGNLRAARASGINVDRVIISAYVWSGLLAAFAGLILAGRLDSVTTNLGQGMVFTVFAAAVVGGVSLQGGRGSMIGALGGLLLLSVIDTGLDLMQVSSFWVQAITGFMILVAVFIDSLRARFGVT